MDRLRNKIALITGAGRGIGRGIALKFARESAHVGVIDRQMELCQTVVDEIEAAGGRALGLAADITNEEQVTPAVARLRDTFVLINVLVNNAAVMPAGG